MSEMVYAFHDSDHDFHDSYFKWRARHSRHYQGCTNLSWCSICVYIEEKKTHLKNRFRDALKSMNCILNLHIEFLIQCILDEH